MSAPTAALEPNDCLVTDNLISSVRELLLGQQLHPLNFADLCSLIEIAILHERIVATTSSLPHSSPFAGSPLEALVENGVVISLLTAAKKGGPQSDQELLSRIAGRCLEAMKTFAIFGRGILNVSASREAEFTYAMARIILGTFFLRMRGPNKLNLKDSDDKRIWLDAKYFIHADQLVEDASFEPNIEGDDQALFVEAYKGYQVFGEYVDAVFEAARHYHVQAYAGSSDFPLAIQNSVASVPRLLYDRLKELQKDRIDRFMIEAGYQPYNIPPFALIVLSRCRSRDDVGPQLLRAREEFSDFRRTCTEYAANLSAASHSGTMEDIIREHNALDRALELLTKKAKAAETDSRLVYRVWNVVKAASPWGIMEKLLDELKDYDVERQALRSVNGLLDVWKKLAKSSSYQAILRSALFPTTTTSRSLTLTTDTC